METSAVFLYPKILENGAAHGLGVAFYPKSGYIIETMSQDQLIQIRNKSTGEVYWTRKNRRKVERKIELKKYSPKLRKHVVFKEGKK